MLNIYRRINDIKKFLNISLKDWFADRKCSPMKALHITYLSWKPGLGATNAKISQIWDLSEMRLIFYHQTVPPNMFVLKLRGYFRVFVFFNLRFFSNVRASNIFQTRLRNKSCDFSVHWLDLNINIMCNCLHIYHPKVFHLWNKMLLL